MAKRRTSLSDVARAAGVGLATASRALTGNSEVGAATRARILETAAELGYRPSLAGQALRAGRTHLIELTVFRELPGLIVGSILDACEARGYHLLLTRPSPAGLTPVVDGRILLDPHAESADANVDESTEILSTASLASDELAGAAQSAVDKLIDRLEDRVDVKPTT